MLTAAADEPRAVPPVNLNIEAQPLGNALNEFGQQSGLQVVFFYTDISPALTSPRLAGKYDPKVALEQLLANTPLAYKFINPRTVAIVAKGEDAGSKKGAMISSGDLSMPMRLARADTAPASSPVEEATSKGPESDGERVSGSATPEILVKNSRILNMDIPRTRDDVQPYVVFSQEDLRNSQASTVSDFLRTRLPMNAEQGTTSQQLSSNGNRSQFNLRGLGANQTLILVDGRRMPGISWQDSSGFTQADINGIAMAAIERIEVLPATASGIYGGSATGGVINIILRRDYTGLDLKMAYGNTFESDVAERRVDASAGFSLEGGRTQLLMTASHSESNPLLAGERDFAERGRALLSTNVPTFFYERPTAAPTGYTTNISGINLVTRAATPLVLKTGVALNSTFTHVPAGYLGVSSDNGAGLVGNAGRYSLVPPDTGAGNLFQLLATPTIESASFGVRRSFSSKVQAYVDFLGNRNEGKTPLNTTVGTYLIPQSALNNPFNNDIFVNVPLTQLTFPAEFNTETLRGSIGAILDLSRGWSANIDYTWNRVRYTGSSNGVTLLSSFTQAVQSGTSAALNVIRDLNVSPLDYTAYLLPRSNIGPRDTVLENPTVRVAGPIWKLPAGAVTLSVLAEHRKEKALKSFADGPVAGSGQINTTYFPAIQQTANSLYAEILTPLVSPDTALPWVHTLDLQISTRNDRYETRGVASSVAVPSRNSVLPEVAYSTNKVDAARYTAGFRYSPIADVMLRASVGTGFLPPGIGQIVSGLPSPTTASLTDPLRGGVPATISFNLKAGGNPALEAEDSESISAGIVFTPRFMTNLRLSADYTQVDKSNEIGSVGGLQALIDLEAFLPGRVTRGAKLSTDPASWAGPITDLDITSVNLSRTWVRAYDFQVDYRFGTQSVGTFDFYAIATRQSTLDRRLLPTSETANLVGFADGPLKWRGNIGMNWSRRALVMGFNAQSYDSYLVYASTNNTATRDFARLSNGRERVERQMYVDAFAKYRLGESAMVRGWLANTEFMLGIQNLFDKTPPILAAAAATGAYSRYGDPRLRRFSLSLQKSF